MIPPRKHLIAFRRDLERLLKELKPTIGDDCRTHKEATLPGIAVTIGAEIMPDGIAWGYQTGDNSYTGGAYGFRDWGIVDLYRRDNSRKLAEEIVEQFLEIWAQHGILE
jgi:hypothetical protein